MSGSAIVEHIWMSPDKLPATLGHMFAKGVCAVFTDEEFTAAIPASNEDTTKLADLAEIWAIGPSLTDPAWREYDAMRRQLCSPLGMEVLTKLFKQEMDRLKEAQDQYKNAENERYIKLASAARPKRVENN